MCLLHQLFLFSWLYFFVLFIPKHLLAVFSINFQGFIFTKNCIIDCFNDFNFVWQMILNWICHCQEVSVETKDRLPFVTLPLLFIVFYAFLAYSLSLSHIFSSRNFGCQLNRLTTLKSHTHYIDCPLICNFLPFSWLAKFHYSNANFLVGICKHLFVSSFCLFYSVSFLFFFLVILSNVCVIHFRLKRVSPYNLFWLNNLVNWPLCPHIQKSWRP